MQRRTRHGVMAMGCGLALLVALPAQATLITREFTGSWFDPAKVGQGFNLDIASSNGAKTAVLYWYTYDATGRPQWLYGQAAVGSSATLDIELFQVSGPRFVQDFSAAQLGLAPFGRITLQFANCNSASAQYQTSAGSGSLALARLTGGFGGTCTGTLVDDGKAVALSGAVLNASGVAETLVALTPSAAAPAASGHLKYRTGDGRVRFDVEIEDVPVGSYSLFGNEVQRGTLTVVTVPGGTQGDLEFSAPADAGKPLLDFDPRGQRFSVRQGNTEWLSGTLAAGSANPPPAGGSGAGAPPFGNALTVVRFGTGAVEAKAELKQEAAKVEFEVELQGVTAGRYELRVADQVRGSVLVQALANGRTYGETEFRNPVEPGKVLLDFDPRGKTVSLTGASGVVAGTTFPTQPNAGGTGSTGGFPTVAQIKVRMSNAGLDPDASGELEFESSSSRQEFKVEVERLDDGSYTIDVDGIARGQMNVVGGRAEVEFRNPVEPGKVLLDFPVLGRPVRLLKGGQVWLSGSIPAP